MINRGLWRPLLISLLCVISFLGPLAVPVQAVTDSRAIYVLNRLSFGPRPGDLEHIQAVGVEGYIKEQLSPKSLQPPSNLKRKLQQLKILKLTPIQVIQRFEPQRQQQQRPAAQKAARQKARRPLKQAEQARIIQAIASPRQLEEVMVNFWFNHFNVSAEKGRVKFWIGDYERNAIRPYALGSFRDLLGATAKHPAMLFYLDNWRNTAPNSPGARGRFQGLNENYARELLELHTLGVNGGYTQADIIATAELLTGWSIPAPRQMAQHPTGFYFNAKRHDPRPKTVLGTKITGQGIVAGEQLLDLLASHPATARQISYELAQYFVADQPPEALVKRLTQRYLKTDGDIRAVLDTLFHSPEFWDDKYKGRKYKTPYEYVLSATRAQGRDLDFNTQQMLGMFAQLGMPLYRCRTPDGYPNTQTEWLNPEAVTRRVSLAMTLTRNRGSQNRPTDLPQLVNTLGDQISSPTQTVVDASPERLRAALLLGSPDFMYR
ncbi:hypothetical protein C1752_03501 [Acaryochloris thomasi RCC1774]|uniref:DUF1800 domain-containing protein n=1 Tax=Acaryochloris thomasi RCC1774 TaxID=1764569 RepID=A0A2W1JMI3_9CYAN|nr:DUF1800 domain-containing protein [Acaryochloris thomasi]PZD72665.1 hypothetical protein C1752_03501 [Acaryochloris thomasi RCC1774]